MATTSSTLTRERIIGDIAEILQVPVEEIGDDTNVLDVGLDSVRLMSLIERWRAAGAVKADLVALASDPVVGAWVRELTEDAAAAGHTQGADR
ncbi:phosphopantetheine-binding protein [Gordonia insulae]|uniref:Isochorismatase n=1 Tax=Gordonia insulae TaxID=2420509 RepID=A0A3G8JH15_9ACTN|nr:phosphopantetheine-binding protein [Gordonia insulae]AZG44377.1 Isochorismatase [Gordonia insulae]